MAKKKKASGKPAAGRRAPRRSAQPSEIGEGSGTAPAPPQPPAAPTQPETAFPPAPAPEPPAVDTHKSEQVPPGQGPVKAPHKKFGKYRCLFNSDDSHKKYDGSDSETNSSIEIRVVDPCASSESDSNAALDAHSDTTSVTCHSPSTLTSFQSHSRDISPMPSVSELQMPQLSINTEVNFGSSMIPHLLTPVVTVVTQDQISLPPANEEIALPPSVAEIALPPPTEEIPLPLPNAEILLPPLNEGIPFPCNEGTALPPANEEIALPMEEEHKSEEPINIPLADQEADEYDDDEVITVVQIVEDDNPDYYYDIQLSSPQNTAVNEETSNVREENNQISQFQQHFEKLNLVNNAELISPMICSDLNESKDRSSTYTPDLPFTRENASEGLLRPDPSLTPSSTLSDDSNSSRVTLEQAPNNSNDSAESSPTGVRRSSRIKTISTLKQKTKGYGLVKTPLKKALMSSTKLKLEELGSDSQEKMPEPMSQSNSVSPTFPVPSDMPVKVKSRWRRSSELEMGAHSPAISPLASPSLSTRPSAIPEDAISEEEHKVSKEQSEKIIKERMSQFQHLDENEYLCERMISKETKKMICDCFMTKEEIERGELGCGEDCLNRLLMIECNYRCPVGERCTNRRFQKMETAPLKVFYADKKGCGVEACVDIPAGEFLMEYIGEVLDYEQFYKRAQAYSDENNLHHYFMSLKGDTVIDATSKGNISRFINHSCDPIAETQKWTVNGELRIGFFSKRDIKAGEELTFDYQFQRFGKEAQRCYCGADICRGWIGAEPDSDDEYEEEDDDVSTSKSESATPDPTSDTGAEPPRAAPRPPRRRPRRARPAFAVPAPDRVHDADIEEDIESLSRTGIKNQSHTLRLSRTVVRAKTRRAQAALLRLLRGADLPCRRLFLDYRGLRLLAPWCQDADTSFKLEMLQTVDRLPVPNKSMAQESRFLTILERWLSAAETVAHDNLTLIDEATGLPIESPLAAMQGGSADKAKDNAALVVRVRELSKQMLERWSSLKEVFKIPKKERIQQMKEHERQANVERRAADSSGARDRDRERGDERRERERERDRDKYRDRDRERERERDRDRDRERDDRDRRKRRSSPDGRRSIRLSERVLTAVPPMSKEERRRAFAESAAAAEEARRRPPPQPPQPCWPQYAGYPHQGQMFPQGMMGGPPNMLGGPPNMLGGPPNMLGGPPNMLGGPPNMLGGPPNMLGGPPMGPEWMQGEFAQPYQPYQYCMQQANFMGMGGLSGFGMAGFMFPPAPTAAYPAPPQPAPAPAPPPPPQQHDATILLPALWRSAVDARGRTYYYHVKLRQPQWEPPPPPAPNHEESSSEEEEVVQPMDTAPPPVRRKGKLVEGVNGIYEVIKEDAHNGLIPEHALLTVKPRKRRPGLVTERPISPRTEADKAAGRLEVKRYKETKEKLRKRKERLLLRGARGAGPSRRRAYTGEIKLSELVETDSESDSDSEDVEVVPLPDEVVEPDADEAQPEEVTFVQQLSELVETDSESDSDSEDVEVVPLPDEVVEPDADDAQPKEFAAATAAAAAAATATATAAIDVEELTRRIKESFRSQMARVMVHHLNPYRHRGAALGRITNTSDFKHLARKLTHFVMLKELKHCRSVEELVVTDSVRSKAKEFVKKYMTKFGPVYKRPAEEIDG